VFKFKFLLLVLLLSIFRVTYAELVSFTAQYEINSMAMTQAMAVNKLKLKDSSYFYHSQISPIGWLGRLNQSRREESSQGKISGQQLIPDIYSYKLLKDNQARRHVEIEFLPNKHKIINHHKHIDNHWQMDFVDGVQDHLSYQLALMLALQQSLLPQKQSDFFFSVADGGRLKKYSFKLLGEENLETPIGLLHTLKLKHKPYKDDNITIWCAADLAYLPVKIVQEKKHSPDYTSIIISYERNNTKIK